MPVGVSDRQRDIGVPVAQRIRDLSARWGMEIISGASPRSSERRSFMVPGIG